LNDYIHHFARRYHLSVDFEPTEKTFDTLENVDKGFLAGANISNRLKGIALQRRIQRNKEKYQNENADTSKDHFRR